MSSDGTIRTKKDLMDLLEREAKLYRKKGIEACLLRNRGSHHFRGGFDSTLADAVLVNFINEVALGQGLDLGLRVHHLDEDGQDECGQPAGKPPTEKVGRSRTVVRLRNDCHRAEAVFTRSDDHIRCPSCDNRLIWDFYGDKKETGVQDDPICHFCDRCLSSFWHESDADYFYGDRVRANALASTLRPLYLSGASTVTVKIVKGMRKPKTKGR